MRGGGAVERATRVSMLVLAPLLVTGCFRIAGAAAKYGIQHSIGARLGPCQARKDSVKQVRGAPYRRYFSDEENVDTGQQLFWHEWGYRIHARAADAHRPDSMRADDSMDPSPRVDPLVETGSARGESDSVEVVGFRWGDGVEGCDVRERRVKAGRSREIPWEGAGDVPGGVESPGWWKAPADSVRG